MIFRPQKTSAFLFGSLLIPLVVVALVTGCANPIPPTGGPRDTTPPQLIEAESTPNFLTEFDQKEITLTFDEWIQLKDPALQIVISPPLVHRPQITQPGKSVVIAFHKDEVLREQTTYTINFGESIVDLNEGNALDQYKFIFSTGTFIDSLSLGGRIVNAMDNEPAGGVLVLLHDNLSDTAFANVLPAYFSKSDENGNWRIENIRSDTFRVYALLDNNPNYKYDAQGESLAFIETPFILSDTSEIQYNLRLFTEELPPIVLDINRRTAGVTNLALNVTTGEFNMLPVEATQPAPSWAMVRDTIKVWNTTPDTFHVALLRGGEPFDTVRINGFPGSPAPVNTYLLNARSVHPTHAINVLSKLPLTSIDTMGIIITRADTVRVYNFEMEIDSADSRKVILRSRWQEGPHQMLIPAGTITDMFGSQNDTLRLGFQVSPASGFGQVFINVEGLADSTQYLVQLLQNNSQEPLDQFILQDVSAGEGSFPALLPQTYRIRVIEDANRNGRWDTGNFAQQRQPERVLLQTLEPLRAGWDLEATITWQ